MVLATLTVLLLLLLLHVQQKQGVAGCCCCYMSPLTPLMVPVTVTDAFLLSSFT
jgi:hypothetical protein